jgi:hypothetical protein
MLLTNRRGTYPKKSPVGVYDKSILCKPCDNTFSPWDKHAQDVLIREFSDASTVRDEGRTIAWTIPRFDYGRLKLFFLSLLWRASISTHPFYERVVIGPFEQHLLAMLKAEDPGPPEAFAVTLAHFDDPTYTAMLDPHPERWFGVNYVRFYLAGFVAHIKVDRRPSPDLLSAFVIRDGVPIVVVRRDAHKGKDAMVMRDIARKAKTRSKASPASRRAR